MKQYDDELDRYLEGEMHLSDLPRRLRAEEERLRELLETVRDDAGASPQVYRAVMREVSASPTPSAPVPAWRRALSWLVQPRTFQIRPATGALVGAAVAAMILLLPPAEEPVEAGPSASVADEVVTRFVFIAPEASSVRITGDFVDWSPEGIALHDERATGIWTVDVPLEPGVYQYGFVIDGEEWRPDPRAVSSVDDGFGRENSVVIVSGENAT